MRGTHLQTFTKGFAVNSSEQKALCDVLYSGFSAVRSKTFKLLHGLPFCSVKLSGCVKKKCTAVSTGGNMSWEMGK